MGDISEMRGLIVMFSIIAITVTLMVLMPPEFYATALTAPDQPSSDPANILSWNGTYIVNVTQGDHAYSWDMNGYYYTLKVEKVYPWDPYNRIELETQAHWGFFVWDDDFFKWYDQEGAELSTSDGGVHIRLPSDKVDLYGNGYAFKCRNGKTRTTATIVYNSTTYTDFQDACANTDFSVVFQVNLDDRNTSLNALALVALILSGQMPGLNSYVAIVFGFISWGFVAAGCYLAFIFILRIIGAVFGGGGA